MDLALRHVGSGDLELKVGLDDPEGVFQMKTFCDSWSEKTELWKCVCFREAMKHAEAHEPASVFFLPL